MLKSLLRLENEISLWKMWLRFGIEPTERNIAVMEFLEAIAEYFNVSLATANRRLMILGLKDEKWCSY